MVTNRANDTDHSRRIRPAKMSSRAISVLRANLLQLCLFAKLAKDFVGADVVFLDPIVIIINCHELYEANVVRSVKSQARQIQNFIVIDSPHCHHVNFYGVETDVSGCLNTTPDPVKLVSVRDPEKFLMLECVQANVDSADAGIVQILGKFFQEDGISCEAEASQTGQLGQPPTEIGDPFAHQWFSAGESHFGNAHVECHLDKAKELLI